MNSKILTEEDYKFMNYISSFGKRYGTKAEFEFRSNIFKSNLLKIAEWESMPRTSTVGVNKFSDRTVDEMKKLNGYRADLK